MQRGSLREKNMGSLELENKQTRTIAVQSPNLNETNLFEELRKHLNENLLLLVQQEA